MPLPVGLIFPLPLPLPLPLPVPINYTLTLNFALTRILVRFLAHTRTLTLNVTPTMYPALTPVSYTHLTLPTICSV